jgi:DNA-binding Lrp family transcriptional regulator
MDLKDFKILKELDKNPRASFTQLGKTTRIGKEVAQYRFKKLQKEKIITGFFAFIDVSKLGYQTNKILIKYKSVNNSIQNSIINYLNKSRIVAWAGLSEGAWDLIITTISSDLNEFSIFFSDFFDKFGKHFIEKEILIPTDNPIFNDKYLSDGELIYNKHLDFKSKTAHIDQIDKKILLELSLNSRKSFVNIGESVGLSYWAVSQRYKKLIESKILVLLKPRINFRKLGYDYYHVLIETNDNKTKEEITKYYTINKSCIMLMNHIGKYSLHLEFVCKKDEFSKIIMDMREQFGEKIQKYEPLLIVEEYVMNLLK